MTLLHKINHPDNLLSDLFRTNKEGKKNFMHNPYNIVWVIDNFLPEKKDFYQPILLDCMENKISFSSSDLDIILSVDMVIIERMKILVSQGANINSKGSIILKSNNLDILKEAVNLGLDVNHKTKDENTLLDLAIKRRLFNIQNWLWTHPQLDKNKIGNSGLNYAILTVQYDNLQIARNIFNTNPGQFLRTVKEKNIFHYLKRKNYLSAKTYEVYTELIDNIIDYIDKEKPQLLNTVNLAADNPFINLIIKTKFKDKLENNLFASRLSKAIKI